jgi:hypothetical protein
VAEEIMMPEGTIADFLSRIEGELEAVQGRLKRSLDFAEVERTLTTLVNQMLTALLEQVLRPVLSDAGWLERLRRLGGRRGMRFKEYRRVRVRLSTGTEVEGVSPYFIKAAPKRGRRKRGPSPEVSKGGGRIWDWRRWALSGGAVRDWWVRWCRMPCCVRRWR